jgi:hypothetical protein
MQENVFDFVVCDICCADSFATVAVCNRGTQR